jgi:hypothetical protein
MAYLGSLFREERHAINKQSPFLLLSLFPLNPILSAGKKSNLTFIFYDFIRKHEGDHNITMEVNNKN